MSTQVVTSGDDNKLQQIQISTKQKLFPQIINDKINTQDFLSASSDVVVLIENLGKVFAPVKYDIQGNIQKLHKKYKEDPERYTFLEDMLLAEQEERGLIAIDALQWLRRALHFILRLIQLIIEDSEAGNKEQNLTDFLKTAYSETLQQYHGWMGSHLFSVLMRFAPSRKDFFSAVTSKKEEGELEEEIIIRDMKIYTESLSVCINHLIEFYTVHGMESHARV